MIRFFASLAGLALVVTTAGCRSAYVEATVHNQTDSPVTLLEVSYPSASFGKDELQAGADFHYRFKILGQGKTKVSWTDSQHHEHSYGGPDLFEGQHGTVMVVLRSDRADWQSQLTPAH